MKPTIEDVAALLCKGAAAPEWVIEKLRERAAQVAVTTEYQDDELDRLVFKSALQLQELLRKAFHANSSKLGKANQLGKLF